MRSAIVFLSLVLAVNAARAADPEVLKQLWDVPTGEVQYQVIKSYDRGTVRVEELRYQSRSFQRQPVQIFGYFCYPKKQSKKLPGILLSHGGGGSASLPRASSWARKGFAVLSIDLPGKGENRSGSRSTGPDMDVVNLLRTQPDPSYNYLIHAVAAARNGINFLSYRPEVDPERIGMIGLSWGGVLTLLTNGQDKRLKAAVNVFGAGYIPEGCTWSDWFDQMPAQDKTVWNEYLDPQNFLQTQHAPILFITGTNDHCYYLPTFQKSYAAVPGIKQYYLIPNLRHRFLASSTDPAFAWLSYYLKGGKPFPQIESLTPYQKTADRIVIPVKVSSTAAIKSVQLYYSLGGPQEWTKKRWLAVKPHLEDGIYYFALPTKLLKPDLLLYASVIDANHAAASTLVRSLFAVRYPDGARTVALSSPICQLYRNSPPFFLLNGLVSSTIRFQKLQAEKVYRPYNLD
jgi:cephalosporin-C deacetylase-like acetyl esterase